MNCGSVLGRARDFSLWSIQPMGPTPPLSLVSIGAVFCGWTSEVIRGSGHFIVCRRAPSAQCSWIVPRFVSPRFLFPDGHIQYVPYCYLRWLVQGFWLRRPRFSPGVVHMGVFFWTKWHCDRVFSKYYGFSLPFNHSSFTVGGWTVDPWLATVTRGLRKAAYH